MTLYRLIRQKSLGVARFFILGMRVIKVLLMAVRSLLSLRNYIAHNEPLLTHCGHKFLIEKGRQSIQTRGFGGMHLKNSRTNLITNELTRTQLLISIKKLSTNESEDLSGVGRIGRSKYFFEVRN